MDFYRSTSSSGGGIIYSPLVDEDSALGTRQLSKRTTRDVVREPLIRRCSSESNPTPEPRSLLPSWLLLLSIHPTSPEFRLFSPLLDLTIFYLVQAVQFTIGVFLLHALYPSEPDYSMTAARSMRIGAAGGAVLVAILTLRSLLQLGCCEPGEDALESEESVWHSMGCLQAKRAPDVRYVAFIGILGSVAFGRGTHDMGGLLHAATAAVVGYAVLSVSKGTLVHVHRAKVGF